MVTKNYQPYTNVTPTGTTTNASGAHTGANIVALAANVNRIGLIIGNPSAANIMYVNFGAAAVVGGAGSIPIPIGTHLTIYGNSLPSENVQVIGTLGQNYTVKEIV